MDLIAVVEASLHWGDILVFVAFILLTLAIGVYYGVVAKTKANSADDFLKGDEDVQMFPVAISLMTSFLCVVLILGVPGEMYTKGTQYWMYMWGSVLGAILSAVFFVPLLHPLHLTCSYEYLARRFHTPVIQMLGTFLMMASQILFLGIVVYSPGTALQAVSGIPEWATIIGCSAVAVIYTTVGGLKASVWAGAFQTLIMAVGVIMVIIKGVMDVGGFGNMWKLNAAGGRIEFFDFDTDPSKRHSFWTLVVGGAIGSVAYIGVNQVSVQRYCTMGSVYKARAAVLWNIPGMIFFYTICCLSGMAIYAYYASVGCDPLRAGYVENANQLIAYYVMDRLSLPGVTGLFMACVFAGSVNSISAVIWTLAAVTWQDFLQPLKFMNSLSDRAQTWITQGLVVLYGIAGVVMAFIAGGLGGTVQEAAIAFTGAAGGPLLGLFCLGAMFPCANKWGALVGGIVGLIIPLWISSGALSLHISTPDLPTSTELCMNATSAVNATLWMNPEQLSGIETIYKLSYLYYTAMGLIIVVVLGLIITFFTGCEHPSTIPAKHRIPVCDVVCCCVPEQTRQLMRCGQDPAFEEEDDEKYPKHSDSDAKGTKKVIGPVPSFDNPIVEVGEDGLVSVSIVPPTDRRASITRSRFNPNAVVRSISYAGPYVLPKEPKYESFS